MIVSGPGNRCSGRQLLHSRSIARHRPAMTAVLASVLVGTLPLISACGAGKKAPTRMDDTDQPPEPLADWTPLDDIQLSRLLKDSAA